VVYSDLQAQRYELCVSSIKGKAGSF